jgi:uncharacterized metal-binding protein
MHLMQNWWLQFMTFAASRNLMGSWQIGHVLRLLKVGEVGLLVVVVFASRT